MTNHRDEAAALFERALAALHKNWTAEDGWESPTDIAIVGILGALLALDDDALAGEEQHQSEKFEATPLDDPDRCASWHFTAPGVGSRCLGSMGHPAAAHRYARPASIELDEDNPDTLVEDDADTIARPLDGGPQFGAVGGHSWGGNGWGAA